MSVFVGLYLIVITVWTVITSAGTVGVLRFYVVLAVAAIFSYSVQFAIDQVEWVERIRRRIDAGQEPQAEAGSSRVGGPIPHGAEGRQAQLERLYKRRWVRLGHSLLRLLGLFVAGVVVPTALFAYILTMFEFLLPTMCPFDGQSGHCDAKGIPGFLMVELLQSSPFDTLEILFSFTGTDDVRTNDPIVKSLLWTHRSIVEASLAAIVYFLVHATRFVASSSASERKRIEKLEAVAE